MGPELVLAIDQGTTNTKVLLVSREGAIAARAARPVVTTFPAPGWVEQDPQALWQSVREAIDDCLGQVRDVRVNAVGITNQRESALIWDRTTGMPLGPCVIWQCRRTAPFCDGLLRNGAEAAIRERTGLGVDPLFSASKLRWLLENIPDGAARASAGELCAGTVDAWLLWNLTGGAVHATDSSNASRTQLLNLGANAWDSGMMELFGIPEAMLPRVVASSGIAGFTSGCGLLAAGIPIGALIGDSHAALFGHGAFAPGMVKATYGTGSSLMSPVEKPVLSGRGLSTTVAWSTGEEVHYALEGNITNTGATVDWVGKMLSAGGPEAVAELAMTVPDAGGVYLVPAFSGLGAPHWDAHARGLICGLTRASGPAEVARAAVESIAFQVADVFEAMLLDTGAAGGELLADGGASRNSSLMQFQADVLGCPVVRNGSADLSAIGAAWLAGLATGFWRDREELKRLPAAAERFEPRMTEARRTELLEGWREAVSRAAGAH